VDALSQRRGQLFVDAIEAAVGKDGDDVTGGKARSEICNNGVGICEERGVSSGFLQGRDDILRMKTL
jgi:hypothetical protein